jgi:hypothetical protein
MGARTVAVALLALGAASLAATAGSGSAPASSLSYAPRLVAARSASNLDTVTSTNWAGYAVAAAGPSATPASGATATFTSVTGTWKQPKVTCVAGSAKFSGAWVGLGGFSEDAKALEQIGTAAECTAAGKPTYYAWYELVPARPVRLNLKVLPGDTITTSVNVNGTAVLVQIKNRTRRTSFTQHLTMDAPDLSSAEWIVEAPSGCTAYAGCRPLPLANFGTVSFGGIATIGNAHPGTVTDPTWTATAVQLVPASQLAVGGGSDPSGATPAALSADGRSFTVSWDPNPVAVPSP